MFTIRLGFLFFTVASLVSCSPNTQNKTNLSDHFALKDSHDSVDRNPLNSNMYSTITQKILDGEVSINGHIYQDSAIELEITGFAISINPQKSPFDGYTQGKIPQLKKITIAADNIDISGTLLLPGIDVTLIAKTISFSKDAIINTSALAYPYFLESLTSKELSAVSFAKKGDRGGNISVYASDLKIQDFTKPLLITRGGQGQNAALGIKGADMPPVPSLKKITFQGMSCDVLHETYYTEEPAFDKDCGPRSKKINKTSNVYPKAIGSCRVPTIKVKHERGLKKWPLAPTDSIAGGTPGAGGDSGNIEILVSKNTELSIISALKGSTLLYEQNIGVSGAVATPALGGKVSGSGCYVFTDADKVSDFRIYQNGQSLSAPQFTQEQSKKGFAKIETGLFQFPISYLQMKYKYIADLYIERDFKKSFALALELETHLNQISSTNTQTDPKFDLLGLNDLKIQTQGLIIRLASNRDYYGLLQSEIPELGVFFAVKEFNETLNSTLNTIYLTEILAPILKQKNINLRESALHLESLSEQIQSDLFSQHNIENQIANLMANIDLLEKSEKNIQAHLQTLEAELREQAKYNIEAKQRWNKIKKAINSVASLTKMIPVYQPALALAGGLAQQLTKLDENKNLGDYIDSASEIYNSIDSLTDKETLAQSKKNYEDFKKNINDNYKLIRSTPDIPDNASPSEVKKIKMEHYKNVSKESLHFAKQTYAKLKPLYEALQKTSEDLKSKSTSISEIEQEFNRIKNLDPVFMVFESTFNKHIYLKAEIYKNTSRLTDSFAELAQKIQESKSIQEKTAQFFLNNSDIYSNDLIVFLEELQKKRFEKIDYLYNNIQRAYEYAYQKKLISPFDSQALKKEILKISGKNLSLENRLSILRSIYLGNINSLFEDLRTQIGMLTPSYRSDIISLSESEITTLNTKNTVTIKVPQASVPFIQSSYIHKIELFPEYATTDFTDQSKTSIVQLSLGKTAKFTQDTQELHYLLNESLQKLSWSTQTTWHRANIYRKQYSPTVPAINLESLYGIKGVKVDIFDLLSKSPALVDLIISKQDKGTNLNLKNLDIKLEVQSY